MEAKKPKKQDPLHGFVFDTKTILLLKEAIKRVFGGGKPFTKADQHRLVDLGELFVRAICAEHPQVFAKVFSTKRFHAPMGYVTEEGVVAIPLELVKQMGLEKGGGVTFITGKDGHVRMLTNEQFFEMIEPTNEG